MASLLTRAENYSTRFTVTWKAKTTRSSRRLFFQLALSERPTSGSEYGLWPTPQTHDITTRGNTEADHHYYPHDLSNAVLLPTPDANDYRTTGKACDERRWNLYKTMSLGNAAMLWPTALSRDYRSGRSRQDYGNSRPLNEAVLLPTPCERDKHTIAKVTREAHAGPGGTPLVLAAMFPTPLPSDVDGGRTTKGKARQAETGLRLEVGGQLNPNFVEWLMGYPKDWTWMCGETASGPECRESPLESRTELTD